MRPLSSTQQDIDRSIEKVLYEALLFYGYTPDRLTNSNPAAYQAALLAIKQAKGFAVELFGNGSPEHREGLQVPRIVITGQGFLPGSAGRDFYISYEKHGVDENYTKYNQGTPLSTYRVRLELWSNAVAQDRIIEAVRQAALPNLSYIPKWDEPEFKYCIQYGFTASVPELKHGLIHKIYTYEVLDVMETELNQVTPGGNDIVPIKEIDVRNDEDNVEVLKVNSTP